MAQWWAIQAGSIVRSGREINAALDETAEEMAHKGDRIGLVIQGMSDSAYNKLRAKARRKVHVR